MRGSDAGWLRWRSSGKRAEDPTQSSPRAAPGDGPGVAGRPTGPPDGPGGRVHRRERGSSRKRRTRNASRRCGGSACSWSPSPPPSCWPPCSGWSRVASETTRGWPATRPREPSSRPTSGPWARLHWWSRELDRALLMAAQAHRLDPTAASRATLLAVAQRSPEVVAIHRSNQQLQHLAASADGDTVAAVGDQGGVYAWSSDTGELVATVPRVAFFGGTSLDLSPDGSQLVVVGHRRGGGPGGPGHQGAGNRHRSHVPTTDRPHPCGTRRWSPHGSPPTAGPWSSSVWTGGSGWSTPPRARPVLDGRATSRCRGRGVLGETTTLEGSANRRFLGGHQQ